MYRLLLSGAVVLGVLAAGLSAQTEPTGFHTIACIKVNAGKSMEYRQFVSDYTRRMMQTSVDGGEYAGWSLLRAVLPAGNEARCDYISVIHHKGIPAPPQGPEGLETLLRKAGIRSTAADFLARRSALTTLNSQELWQSVIRIAEPEKGDYLYVNFAKVPNLAKYIEFEKTVWQPMAEALIKEGSLRAWMVNRAVLPGGTEVKYPAVSVDVFPSWEAVFQFGNIRPVFDRVHPGKDFDKTFADLPTIRNLAKRELYFVQEKVKGPEKVSSR